MMAITTLPNNVTLRSFATAPRQPLAPLLFTLAFLLFLGDTLAALFLGGGWHRLRGMTAALLILLVIPNDHAMAQAADDYAQKATQETRLAYVRTGDDTVDTISEEGLKGLGLILSDRTSVIPGSPIGVNIESDEIVFFPLVYWPVLDSAAVPTPATLAKMDAYMKNGGTIFFDLRDDALGLESLSGAARAQPMRSAAFWRSLIFRRLSRCRKTTCSPRPSISCAIFPAAMRAGNCGWNAPMPRQPTMWMA